MSPKYTESGIDGQDETGNSPEESDSEKDESQKRLKKRFGIDRPFYSDNYERQVRSWIKKGELDKAAEVHKLISH